VGLCASPKGGAGKTTAAVVLGTELAQSGATVTAIDVIRQIGQDAGVIAFSRNATSYFSRPMLRSQSPVSICWAPLTARRPASSATRNNLSRPRGDRASLACGEGAAMAETRKLAAILAADVAG
jgi:hypothetical protein